MIKMEIAMATIEKNKEIRQIIFVLVYFFTFFFEFTNILSIFKFSGNLNIALQ